MSNVDTVKEIYAAFSRGDVPAILERLSADVEWEYAYGESGNPVPWLQARKGKAGAAGFFESLAATEITRFAPRAILDGPDLVVALVDIEFTVKSTGRRVVETDEAHVWRFDESGRVCRFRHCADTYQHAAAFRGAMAQAERR